jgi:hypothetical protein
METVLDDYITPEALAAAEADTEHFTYGRQSKRK